MDEWLNESKKISDVAKKVELRLIESLHRNEVHAFTIFFIIVLSF